MSQITINFGWLSTIIVGIDEYHIDNNLILSSVLKKWSTRMNKTLEQMCKCNEMWIIWLLILLLVYKNLIYILLYIALKKVTLLWIKYRNKTNWSENILYICYNKRLIQKVPQTKNNMNGNTNTLNSNSDASPRLQKGNQDAADR